MLISIIFIFILRELCSCATQSSQKEEVSSLAHAYSRRMEEAIASGRYDTSDDFTVVYQPFMRENEFPRLVSLQEERHKIVPN